MLSRMVGLVSVIIPAYNAEDTIAETICSVLEQAYQSFEIIVVDDGSVDNTRAVVRELGVFDQRVKLVTQKNEGPGSARNTGIRHANGAYVAFLDADDIWHKDKIQKQLEVIVNSRDCDCAVVYSPCRLIDMESNVIRTLPLWRVRGLAYYTALYYNFAQNGSSILVDRKVFEQVGGYDVRREIAGHADILFLVELSKRFYVKNTEEYLVGYRVHNDSLSANVQAVHASTKNSLYRYSRCGLLSWRICSWHMTRVRLRLLYDKFLKRQFDWEYLLLSFKCIAADPLYSIGSLIKYLWTVLPGKSEIPPNANRHFADFNMMDVGDAYFPIHVRFRLLFLRLCDHFFSKPR